MPLKRPRIVALTFGGVFCALFFVASNVLPPITPVPSVPVTLQIFVLALAAGTLGARDGLRTLLAVFALTLCGVPMMSGFSAGPGAFLKPTAGYMLGWFLPVFLLGRYADRRAAAGFRKGRFLVGFALWGTLGMIGVYLCGSAVLALYGGRFALFWDTLRSNLLMFGIFDLLKVGFAGPLALRLRDLIATETAPFESRKV